MNHRLKVEYKEYGTVAMIEYDKFQNFPRRFEQQGMNCFRTVDLSKNPVLEETVAESVIRRFQTCYDCPWKVLRQYLAEELGAPDSPEPLFRPAFENNLFPAPLERWPGYANTRIDNGHDYSGERTQECLATVSNFINDAAGLYRTMSAETWN